jgi:hypothetical protein
VAAGVGASEVIGIERSGDRGCAGHECGAGARGRQVQYNPLFLLDLLPNAGRNLHFSVPQYYCAGRLKIAT